MKDKCLLDSRVRYWLRKKVAEMVGKNRDRQTGEEVVSQALEGFQREFQIGGVLELELLAHVIYVRSGVVLRPFFITPLDQAEHRNATEPVTPLLSAATDAPCIHIYFCEGHCQILS